jgi:hypothetical protein
MSLDLLPLDLIHTIITADPQTWRAMRLVSTYYHQLLNWDAYVDKFTVMTTDIVVGHWAHTARTWLLDGKLHREHDLPAVIYADGGRLWYQYGCKHRDHGRPACVGVEGACEWYQHGKLHRDDDRPARIIFVGNRIWYQHGERHRDHDRPATIMITDTYEWSQHGKVHRDHDRPSYFYQPGNLRAWHQHGKLHRDHDRPAITHADGSRTWVQRESNHCDLPMLINVTACSWMYHGRSLDEPDRAHREHNRPARISGSGGRYWFRDGKMYPMR